MGDVVVLTTRARVAKWATGIVARRGPFGTRFDLAPIVIHITAAMIESLLDPAEPVLGIFAAWSLGDRDEPAAHRVIQRAIDLGRQLPVPLRGAHRRAISGIVGARFRAHFMELMMRLEDIPETPAMRRRPFAVEWRENIDLMLGILEARALPVTADDRRQMQACHDLARVEAWVLAAMTAPSVAAVLATEGSSPPELPPPPAVKRVKRTAKATPKRTAAGR